MTEKEKPCDEAVLTEILDNNGEKYKVAKICIQKSRKSYLINSTVRNYGRLHQSCHIKTPSIG